METQQRVASPSAPLGDETLVGTQLQVISQVQDRVVARKFQITSAVGLSFSDARDFEQAFPSAPATALDILQRVAQTDKRFAAVLAGAFKSNGKFSPPNVLEFAGRDGFPNFRLILDFRVDGPTATFQLHTILDFNTSDGPVLLEAALSRGDVEEILGLVQEHCHVENPGPLEGMLRGALS